MKIASVIVDVPTLNTDRPFDYGIPDEWVDLILPGMRVVVPFGNRKVQGFVVDIKKETDFPGTLKNIIEPLDPLPVLNKELLYLGDYLAETTLCFKISAYQVMLPPALKAKYEKYLVLGKGIAVSELPEPFQELFFDKKRIPWEEAEKVANKSTLYRLTKKGFLEVVYDVKSKGTKKLVTYYLPALSETDFLKAVATGRWGKKQQQIIQFFTSRFAPASIEEINEAIPDPRGSLATLVKRGLLKKEEYEEYRDPYKDRTFKRTRPLPLTESQQKVIAPILKSVEEEEHRVYLLHGVTGSGKTEIYLQSIDAVIKRGKEAIVLVPEISLTPQMVERFKGRFGNNVAVLHSRLSTGEKYDEWRKIQRKEVQVVVGARSAIFAPFENLGIIIIDEEHETSYKQEDTPRYHARDVAIERSRLHSCPVVLGSATPSLESYARAQKGVYHLLTLEKRINETELPPVHIVDMRDELKEGNRSMFSRILMEKIKERLEKREQIVLLLNRRGYSSFVMCRDCGLVIQCPHCEISLTYHKFGQKLKCHYCGYEEYAPNVCPDCGSQHIRFFGSGTQKVEEELGKLIPEARVIRMDVDTTRRKGAHEKLLADFQAGKADILLGTQMIAKGLDFPNITLVGVLSADTSLHIPDFRASEKTFQLLTQVSGRAGRHEKPGEVIIQTYTPEHYSIQLAQHHDYRNFYRYEMKMRKRRKYPPYFYIAYVQVSHEDVSLVIKTIEQIANMLKNQLSPQAIVLGPQVAPIARINNRFRYQIIVKYKREPNLLPSLQNVITRYHELQVKRGLSISVDLNPFSIL